MGLDWSTVRAEHVKKACELIVARDHTRRMHSKGGLFVLFQQESLPAKQVIRIAYCLANNMSLESKVKFASGEGTLNRLRALGFVVKREPETPS